MNYLHFISPHPFSLFTQGLSLIFDKAGDYKVSVMDAANPDDHNLSGNELAILLCEAGLDDSLIQDSINALRSHYSALLLIIRGRVNARDIQSLLVSGNCRMGIIDDQSTVETLLDFIKEFHANSKNWMLSPGIMSALMDDVLFISTKGNSDDWSTREQEIISLARQGYSLEETAVSIGLSKNTVAAYRSKILSKAGVRSMAQLVADNK